MIQLNLCMHASPVLKGIKSDLKNSFFLAFTFIIRAKYYLRSPDSLSSVDRNEPFSGLGWSSFSFSPSTLMRLIILKCPGFNPSFNEDVILPISN